jgi:hypothetical protein
MIKLLHLPFWMQAEGIGKIMNNNDWKTIDEWKNEKRLVVIDNPNETKLYYIGETVDDNLKNYWRIYDDWMCPDIDTYHKSTFDYEDFLKRTVF